MDRTGRRQGNALSIEAANPRHEHEWNVFEQVRLPMEKILIPEVIDSCTNYIEHPEVVAQRLVRFARVVGRENVIAGTDCGFDTFAGASAVAPSVAWAKLQSLADGARLASQKPAAGSPVLSRRGGRRPSFLERGQGGLTYL